VELQKNTILSPEKSFEDDDFSLRPKTLDQFIGQKNIVDNFRVFIKSALMRKVPLDHVLLAGPPGLGKTTLAFIIAREMGVNVKATSAPAIDKTGDLASILTGLEDNDILFIDEIHRLSAAVEEVLYPAMEDRKIDILIGQGVGAKTVKISLSPFTLIGATTRTGLLTSAFRDRFGIPVKLDYYNLEDLKVITSRSASILGYDIQDDALTEIAQRSRRTPRIVNRLLKRVTDFAIVADKKSIDKDIADFALNRLNIDHLGLEEMDRKILSMIIDHYDGGPVGIKTIAVTIGEEKDTVEDYYEPFLVQAGLLKRTARGRVVSKRAYEHLNMLDKYNDLRDGLNGISPNLFS